MSYNLNVYLSRRNMPTPSAWRAAIIAAGFPVELDSEFDVETSSGFRPAPVRGQMSGFEYYASPMAAELAQKLRLDASINFMVVFAIGSRPLEIVSALSAASVLASVSGGVLVDPQEGKSFSASEAIAWAQTQIAQGWTRSYGTFRL
jgi:hypothetical protein